MRNVRSYARKQKKTDSPDEMSAENSGTLESQEQTSIVDKSTDITDSYSMIYINSLTSFLKETRCFGCSNLWNGTVSIKKREGLYVHYEFVCSNCHFVNDLHSSPQTPISKRRDINVRVAIGGVLSGLGRGGLVKLFGALNLPPPVEEKRFHETQELLLDYIVEIQEQSMANSVEQAVIQTNGSRELKLSGDGAWLTRGHSSIHGIAALCSTTTKPKVLDATWSSKSSVKCQGAKSLRISNPELHRIHKENH